MKTKQRDVWTVIAIIILILYAVFLVYPLVTLLSKSVIDVDGNFSMQHFQQFFSKKYYYSSILNSMKVTISVTALSILIATPIAYLMNTVKIKFSGTIEILILISSLSPPFIGAYSWILLLGRNGVITNFFANFLNIKLPDIYGFAGIVLVLTLQLIPLIYMYISGAMKSIDASLLEASESLGTTGVPMVFKVVLPLILPTLLAGGLLVFMRALADFGTPMLIGEGYRTVPVLIYNAFISEMGGDDGFAAAISVMVVIFATTIFLLQNYITKKKAYEMSSLRVIEPKKVKGFKNIIAHIFIYAYIVIALAPQLYVIYTSFLKVEGRMFVGGYSLDSYQIAFSKLGNSIQNTLIIGIISILVILLFAVLIAYITVRRQGALATMIDITTMFPYIVPGSILGIALLVTFNKKPLLLAGSAVILILSFVIRRLAYTVRSSSAILHQISISTEEAAISLGASNLKTFFLVTLPAMITGVFSGAILSWISILTELSTSILLFVPSTRTITVAIYTEVTRGNYGTAAALSAILTALIIFSLFLFYRLTGETEISL